MHHIQQSEAKVQNDVRQIKERALLALSPENIQRKLSEDSLLKHLKTELSQMEQELHSGL